MKRRLSESFVRVEVDEVGSRVGGRAWFTLPQIPHRSTAQRDLEAPNLTNSVRSIRTVLLLCVAEARVTRYWSGLLQIAYPAQLMMQGARRRNANCNARKRLHCVTLGAPRVVMDFAQYRVS